LFCFLFIICFVASNFSLFVPGVLAAPTFSPKPTLIQNLKDLCDAYPDKADYVSAGHTFLGDDMWLFRVGNPEGGVVFWDACQHGWEDLGSEVIFLIAKWLLTNDSVISNRILNGNYILLMPVVNMDSYERENANYTLDAYGVDINQNFPVGWVYIEPANTGFPKEFHGDAPASEIETKNTIAIFERYKPEYYMTMHYGGSDYLGYAENYDMNEVSRLINRIMEISYETGVEPYRTHNCSGEGMSQSTAATYNATSFLLESASETSPIITGYAGGSGACYAHLAHNLTIIESYFFPKILPILRAMAEGCESPTNAIPEFPLAGTLVLFALPSSVFALVFKRRWAVGKEIKRTSKSNLFLFVKGNG
jgi:hypothetical protein